MELGYSVSLLFILLYPGTICTQALTVVRRSEGLVAIPADIDANVTVFDCGDNLITEIKQTDFNDKYPDLKELWLHSNRITSVEYGSFKGTSLEYVRLISNKLTTIPDFREVRTTLERILIGSNLIRTVAVQNVNYLTNLKTLGLNGNRLSSLHDMSQIFPNLRLHVQRCLFHCCYEMTWMKDFPRLQIDTAPCLTPSYMVGMPWSNISEAQLQNVSCPGEFVSFSFYISLDVTRDCITENING